MKSRIRKVVSPVVENIVTLLVKVYLFTEKRTEELKESRKSKKSKFRI